MFNTLYYSVGVVPLGIAVSLGLSQLIFNLGRRTQMFYKGAFYLPMVVSGVVMSLVWLWMFDPVYGLLNWLFQQAGLEPLLWLRSPKTAMPSLILMAVATGQGASIVLLTASMGSIGPAIRVSTGGRKRMARVSVYNGSATTAHHSLFTHHGGHRFVPGLQLYLRHDIGCPYHATETAVYLLYTYAFQMLNFSRASAIGVILALILALVSALQYRFVARGNVEY